MLTFFKTQLFTLTQRQAQRGHQFVQTIITHRLKVRREL